ncbi:hypothetical protein SAMN05518801_11751 [Novosphingobium sp. CF614]|uniref:hypothetical protein n=1 Tax=Novosphingobium sp. CF614 TaxID=1884364 RepID=UPI0008EC2DFD|nr:hypothetical protein [Novosphingobium sp. CF614]SFG33414.1 hypothetical protein SAMN05518801_11751 [Novosphingobium sp. CF614]
MSEDWISAREAAEVMWPGKRPAPVPNAITKRAEEGLIEARAELLTKQGPGGKTKVPDDPIPTEFWGGRAMVPDWESGVFTAHVQQNASEEEWKAFGVTFKRSKIEAMAPLKTGEIGAPAPAPTLAKNQGGNPGKYDWAVAVGTIVFKWSDPGNWQPLDVEEVRAALETHFAKTQKSPDEKLFKKYAEWIFQEIEKRK